MDTIELASPAKINLTLEVSEPRGDGYHNIDSVVQTIDLSDTLTVTRVREGIYVEADAPDVPCGSENLVYRACRAFLEETGAAGGAKCRIRKAVPAQAGLGGGSSNAAAAIMALDILYETRLSIEQLKKIAARVGSDVPLFTVGGTVRMRGRGDRLSALPDAPRLDLVIVKPPVGVSTAWAYAELDRSARSLRKGSSEAIESAVASGQRERIVKAMSNDFEPVVCAAFPAVALAKNTLTELGAARAMLCGSGSAVFGVFGSREEAAQAADDARRTMPEAQVFVCSFLSRKAGFRTFQRTAGSQ